MLGADVVVAQRQGFAQGQLEDLLGARRERDLPGRRPLRPSPRCAPRPHAPLRPRSRSESKHARRHALFFAKQAQQQVLGADVVVLESARLFLGEHHNLSGAFGEALEHDHSSSRHRSRRCLVEADRRPCGHTRLPAPAPDTPRLCPRLHCYGTRFSSGRDRGREGPDGHVAEVRPQSSHRLSAFQAPADRRASKTRARERRRRGGRCRPDRVLFIANDVSAHSVSDGRSSTRACSRAAPRSRPRGPASTSHQVRSSRPLPTSCSLHPRTPSATLLAARGLFALPPTTTSYATCCRTGVGSGSAGLAECLQGVQFCTPLRRTKRPAIRSGCRTAPSEAKLNDLASSTSQASQPKTVDRLALRVVDGHPHGGRGSS